MGKKARTYIIVILGLILIGIVAVYAVYEFYINKPHKDYEKEEAAYVMSASELFNAYTTDKLKADELYTGKVIQINGELGDIEVADSMVIAVFIFEEGMFGDEGIRCTVLPKFNEELLDLSPGEKTEIKGYCTGYNDTDVIMEKCSLVR